MHAAILLRSCHRTRFCLNNIVGIVKEEMASCPDNEDDPPGNTSTMVIGHAISESVRTILKITKLQSNKNIEPIIEGLKKHTEEIFKTVEGRQLLRSTKQMVSKIKDKEAFMAIMWKIFNIARRVCRNGRGKFGLFLMGAGIVVFLLSSATGLGEGALAVWLTIAGRTFASHLFTRGTSFIRKSMKEVVPNKQALVTLLNLLVSSGQAPQLSSDEIRQLETMERRTSQCSYKDWVFI